ncbi:MAG TPA: hypothetical protein VJ919_12075, partial [Tangfeifania sp.]|nr:hypothetical protein [Tangfeifania sp.]
SVMGGEQASSILKTIGQNGSESNLADQFQEESTAYFSSSRVWAMELSIRLKPGTFLELHFISL